MQYWVASPGSLTTIHTWAHLALRNPHEGHLSQQPTSDLKDSEMQSIQVSLTLFVGKAATLFYCEAPEMFFGLWNFTWLSIGIGGWVGNDWI